MPGHFITLATGLPIAAAASQRLAAASASRPIAALAAKASRLSGASTFIGGIVNSGLIGPKTGICVHNVTSYSGGISNASGGTITATAIGVFSAVFPDFSGNISNAGTISAPTGIKIASSTLQRRHRR